MRIWALLLLWGLAGCQPDSGTPGISNGEKKATQVMRDFRLTDMQKGKKNMMLYATEAQLFEERHVAELENPDAAFLKQGKASSRLTAPRNGMNVPSPRTSTPATGLRNHPFPLSCNRARTWSAGAKSLNVS